MAFISTDHRNRAEGSAVADFFAGLANGFGAYLERRARTDQIRALNRLSDDELSRMGLTRDQIPFHVFRDRFGL
ncbi:DUF1127 domain-containing protein [Rhodobacteraceae bacterium 2376]|uniref:DUF1127 domain-containing protein n=1 Tax=Rhabdonatronobacter sediminivivens TaxID=2743469 RepID=A0A7Z0KXS8_9RHOB|nr:DUF1127 domain-containing protein [Rhabdonatronobacter sediminivivens]NYS23901.1 DUF1127 domain-containing protein [Rhabdonatronobacter sediminivivens]